MEILGEMYRERTSRRCFPEFRSWNYFGAFFAYLYPAYSGGISHFSDSYYSHYFAWIESGTYVYRIDCQFFAGIFVGGVCSESVSKRVQIASLEYYKSRRFDRRHLIFS